ncbi:tRNA methyltransferase tyw3 [Dissophora globulifera]|uniref:tRNA(Phe) (4-demethylwyosine(37)-C(7)) aminocarboxypropyltransferase n=1 Tax=Dissophora globulifera TaxID=979702 RepID=A0A9P6UVU8_9FUNG|nr:tRNA methyltransferase tyw3 [Dissophora globulifera]
MASTVPVLLAPANLTKHLKVLFDTVGWRDKSKLIARYTQILATRQPDQHPSSLLTQDGRDLTNYKAMALLPTDSLATYQTSTTMNKDRIPLSELPQGLTSPLSTLDWPAALSDPSTQQSIFLTWIPSSAFAAPKHLVVQTPLEKLQQGISDFLEPFLQSWAADSCNSDTEKLSPAMLPQLIASIPQKWEHYSDFTLLPPTAFQTAPWPSIFRRLQMVDQAPDGQQTDAMARWEQLIQAALGSSHIARKAIIPVQDVLRRPQIRPLTGNWNLHNRYKSWIEDDLRYMEHQDVETKEATQCSSNSVDSSDTLATPDNFSRAYWAETCQNHVWYRWAPMFTMFSAGNITEKERVAKSRPIYDAHGKTVVDLYAGIGYFSLVYLVHAGAKTVHACEWNPWSVEGLLQGADRNGIHWKAYKGAAARVGSKQDSRDEQPFEQSISRPRTQSKKSKDYGQLTVYPGDNSQWIGFFEKQAHHVNLGLIPSAEQGWVLGVRALCPIEGGYLHVHHNIRIGEEEGFKSYLLKSLRELFEEWQRGGQWSVEIRHTENVKSFAPMVFHYVIDVECRPATSAIASE